LPPQDFNYAPPRLSPEQESAAGALRAKLGRGFSATLLDGVTGSGKTEVYFAMAAAAVEDPLAQALILLPEIALTSQFLSKFEARFGASPVIWHSAITPAARRESFKAIADGRARIIAGTRSALFLPFKNLAMIALDEEHDASYKQEDGAVYNGRDMAVLKAKTEGIPIALASATPSLETYKNALDGKYGRIVMSHRFGGAGLPEIRLVDMRSSGAGKQCWISDQLGAAISQALADKEQVMLYINRRGYAPLVLCGACGHRIGCPNCSTYLSAHSLANLRTTCHYCGHTARLPLACPECGRQGEWILCGPGVERIEEEVGRKFPGARTAIISSDEITSPSRLYEIVRSIESRETDIVIGTQIIAKGHHFPSLTLVGAIDGDMSLAGGNLRANEATFQILTQVSGRSGRGDAKGRVYIQTFNPQNPVMQAIARGDRDGFLAAELAARKEANMPPFSKLAAVILTSKDKGALESHARAMAAAAPRGVEGIACHGPIDAPLAQIQKQHRKRFLIVADKGARVQGVIAKWTAMVPPPSSVRVKIDIDPYSFL
ncbi:MAG: primosomal protein N', partial [Rickettsiales bacterium]|nr:primosomal protein N' [Rickettsiales bacterium]